MKHALLRTLALAGRTFRRTPLARSAFLNRVFAVLSLWLHGSNEAKVGPFKVRFDPRDRVIAKKLTLYGNFEENEIRLLCSFVKQGDHVLDVGANIGLYSLYLSRAVGSGGRVIAVEPDPDNLTLLRTNLEANGCTNVTIVPYALGTDSSAGQLFQDPQNRGHLSLANLDNRSNSIAVSIRRGEEMLAELQARPTIAKIDVEGAEPLVIKGLGKLKPKIILFEFTPRFIASFGHDPAEFLHSLAADGYAFEFVDPQNGNRIPSTVSDIVARTMSLHVSANVLAIRG